MKKISLESLLDSMIDYDLVARWPEHERTCAQASSYNRKQVTPEDPIGWFANDDYSQFIRVEKGGGKEHVMMDSAGPGAIVRFWLTTTSRDGKLRIYLDGADEPAIVFPGYDLLKGPLNVGVPLLTPHTSYKPDNIGGSTLYLPIPYSKHCKVTWEDADPANMPPRYYQINYVTYEPETQVETFTMAVLECARPLIEKVGKALINPPQPDGCMTLGLSKSIMPDKTVWLDLPAGPAAVRTLEITLSTSDPDQIAQALRSTVLQMSFDGEQTVWCPVGDFSGAGVGGRPMSSWYRSVSADGKITCRWVMPYHKSARVSLLNAGKSEVSVSLSALVGDWKWDSRSMHFHANWRHGAGVRVSQAVERFFDPENPPIDWNYVTISGKGVYLGDSLALYNPKNTWYGEGDERIWVDGESLPSHLGTGLEDYYNASWAPVVVFHTPFANAPRVDDPSSLGHNTFTRTRNLDAVPFTKSLRMDMEMVGWQQIDVDCAATTYWYGFPGARASLGQMPAAAALPLPG